MCNFLVSPEWPLIFVHTAGLALDKEYHSYLGEVLVFLVSYQRPESWNLASLIVETQKLVDGS